MTEAASYPNRYAGPKQPEAKPAFNMIERVDPKKVSFSDGDCVSGILIRIEAQKIDGKPVSRYTIEELESKELVFFFGTHQIDQKLMRGDVGHLIEVTCTGQDQAAARNGNPMKTFRIRISDRYAPGWAEDGTLIGDDDIPANLR